MKKIFSVAALVVLGMASAQAQDLVLTSSEKTSYGSSTRLIPTVGVASMQTIGNDMGADTGASAGALAEFGKGTMTGGIGLNYLQAGGKEESGSSKLQFNLNYLQAPVYGKFNFSGDETRTGFLKLGVAPSFLVSKKFKETRRGRASEADVEGVANFDLMASVGIGGAIPMSTEGSLVFGIDFVRGLLKTNTNGSDSINNQGFIGSVGYSIGL